MGTSVIDRTPHSTPLPTTMRAWVHSQAGTPSDVLTLSPHEPCPSLTSPIDVLVRITHAALNPGASILMQLCPFLFRSKPAIPELDFSGIIIATGPAIPKARHLEPGTFVFGSVGISPHLKRGAGALAEYIAISATNVVRKPDNASFEQAAGLGVAGCTAVLLVKKARLKRGDSVLVNGASGGIGTIVMQLVREVVGDSGRVVAVCSGRNLEMVGKLGANEVIDYQAHSPLHQHLATQYANNRFNAIIDAHGIQDLYTHCAAFLRPECPFVTVGVAFETYTISAMLYAVSLMLRNSLWPRMLGGVPRAYVCVTGIANFEAMQELADFVEAGTIKVVVDGCWDMGDVMKAYERILARRAKGKVVIKIQD